MVILPWIAIYTKLVNNGMLNLLSNGQVITYLKYTTFGSLRTHIRITLQNIVKDGQPNANKSIEEY